MNDYVAGLFAGVISTLSAHPIDTLKVTMQSHSTHSIPKAMKSIIRLNSIKGFYRGVSPNLLSQTISQTSFYGTYASCLRFLGSDRDNRASISLTNNFLAACFGGFVQSPLMCVLELLKIRLQTTSHRQEANVYQVFRHVLKTEGFRGLFRGLHATIWRDTPTYGVFMMLYDPLKDFLHLSTNNELLGGFISGGVVGVIAWTLACPADILETYRLGNGIRGFYCGWTAIAARAFLLNSISLFVWDRTRSWFG